MRMRVKVSPINIKRQKELDYPLPLPENILSISLHLETCVVSRAAVMVAALSLILVRSEEQKREEPCSL